MVFTSYSSKEWLLNHRGARQQGKEREGQREQNEKIKRSLGKPSFRRRGWQCFQKRATVIQFLTKLDANRFSVCNARPASIYIKYIKEMWRHVEGLCMCL